MYVTLTLYMDDHYIDLNIVKENSVTYGRKRYCNLFSVNIERDLYDRNFLCVLICIAPHGRFKDVKPN